MLDTIRRSLLHHDVFDYAMFVVEVLVLVLITYEVGSNIWHRIRQNRRSKRIFKAFIEGQSLFNSIPGWSDEDGARAWAAQIAKWVGDTNTALMQFSFEASAAFLHSSGEALDDSVVGRVNPSAQYVYRQLQQRLNSLRAILERPEVYF